MLHDQQCQCTISMHTYLSAEAFFAYQIEIKEYVAAVGCLQAHQQAYKHTIILAAGQDLAKVKQVSFIHAVNMTSYVWPCLANVRLQHCLR
jgi:hypothetical protein